MIPGRQGIPPCSLRVGMTRVGVGCWDGDSEAQGLKPAYWWAIGGAAEAVHFPVVFSSESLELKSKAADRSVRSTFTPWDRASPPWLNAFLLALTRDFCPFGKLRAGSGAAVCRPSGAGCCHPRLAPWAVFLRRSAADFFGDMRRKRKRPSRFLSTAFI